MAEADGPPPSSDIIFDIAENIYFKVLAGIKYVREALWIKLEAGKKFADEHPVVAVFGLVAFLMCSVPVFFFCAFAIGSMVVMFTAFVFVEGKS